MELHATIGTKRLFEISTYGEKTAPSEAFFHFTGSGLGEKRNPGKYLPAGVLWNVISKCLLDYLSFLYLIRFGVTSPSLFFLFSS